jgi:hypothetical protein
MTDVEQLEVGQYASCAIRSGGELWCWGMYNTWPAPGFRTPVRIDSVGPVRDVALGGIVGTPPDATDDALRGSMCVLNDEGRVRCWGRNQLGQVGDGTTEQAPTPVDVVGLP